MTPNSFQAKSCRAIGTRSQSLQQLVIHEILCPNLAHYVYKHSSALIINIDTIHLPNPSIKRKHSCSCYFNTYRMSFNVCLEYGKRDRRIPTQYTWVYTTPGNYSVFITVLELNTNVLLCVCTQQTHFLMKACCSDSVKILVTLSTSKAPAYEEIKSILIILFNSWARCEHACMCVTLTTGGCTGASSCLRLRADRVVNGEMVGRGWHRRSTLIYDWRSAGICSLTFCHLFLAKMTH